jgi:hypothetical protein
MPANSQVPEKLPEPWLRGTLTDVPPVQRAVLHALQLAEEDLERWCSPLTSEELHARPWQLPSVAFHFKHIARSLDRLLTYAEGRQLSDRQLAHLKQEMDGGAERDALFAELRDGWRDAALRVRAFSAEVLMEPRAVGRRLLPTTVGGLLVHVADHTQRHVGQAITTAKVVVQHRGI